VLLSLAFPVILWHWRVAAFSRAACNCISLRYAICNST